MKHTFHIYESNIPWLATANRINIQLTKWTVKLPYFCSWIFYFEHIIPSMPQNCLYFCHALSSTVYILILLNKCRCLFELVVAVIKTHIITTPLTIWRLHTLKLGLDSIQLEMSTHNWECFKKVVYIMLDTILRKCLYFHDSSECVRVSVCLSLNK